MLGLEIHAKDPLPGLVAGLADKRMLLVIDNCEHLIDAAANLTAMLLRGAPGISIVATSRERLGVDGEREYRLPLLAIPPPSSRLTAAHALAFPAVQLFAERVSALIDDFEMSDADVPLVVEICRSLDGLPLAIEFAAARVEVLGIRGLAMSVANEPRPASNGERSFAFGSLRLFPSQRLLLDGDKPVRLGSRALDILAVLAEHAGRVVSKEELIARVWPNVFVEESNLKLQVSALRRALGDGQGGARYIVTVPGRGYEFVAPVRRTAEPPKPPPTAVTEAGRHNLPVAVTRMIGRDETVAALVSRLSRERLVTIVGPGGIGKTTVALAVGEALVPAYEHGVWLIDLAPLGDPDLVPSAVATAIGAEIRGHDATAELIAKLNDKRMLLLLDNCERVIDPAARLATALVRGAAGISILATSREPLRVAGEREFRLGPLSSPTSSAVVTAAETLAVPAVQLFVERASAIVEDFALTDANAPLVVDICRKLDGLPLAIEFAAARIDVLGIRGLAAHLGNSLQFLGTRRRTERRGTERCGP